MVFLHPVFHAFHHILPHHSAFRCRFVAASRGISPRAVGTFAVEISGYGAVEVGTLDVHGVVVDHVEHKFDARLVERLHHFLEFADAGFGVFGVGGVASFGDIVVERVVTPVVLWQVGAAFVNCEIVVRGQDVHVRHAEVAQVVDSCGLSAGGGGAVFGKCHEASLVVDAAGG